MVSEEKHMGDILKLTETALHIAEKNNSDQYLSRGCSADLVANNLHNDTAENKSDDETEFVTLWEVPPKAKKQTTIKDFFK